MTNQTVANELQQALIEFENVMAELNRPKRDVVMLPTCDLIKKAVREFLHAYLVYHHVRPVNDAYGMYNQCIKVSAEFAKIDFEAILCLDEETPLTCQRCLENGWINNCAEVLKGIKSLILKPAKNS